MWKQSPSVSMMSLGPSTQRRWIRVSGVIAVLIILWQMLQFYPSYESLHLLPQVLPSSGWQYRESPPTLDFVRRANERAGLKLTPTIRYRRRCLTAAPGHMVERQTVANLSEPLITQALNVSLGQIGTLPGAEDCVPIPVSISPGYPQSEQFPDLIFGMATLYHRLVDSVDTIIHWASGRGCKLVVILEDYSKFQEEVVHLKNEFQTKGVDVILLAPFHKNHTMSQSHFMVLTSMLAESTPGTTKWFGLLDDDTFFPHLAPLSRTLGGLDHKKDMYVGGLSEDFGSIMRFGIMAYGGAGVFLSAALAKKMGEPKMAAKCLDESPPELGDVIIRDCVYKHSTTRLTVLPDFYQHDMIGDLRGFFESGVDPLNLHHWKSWYGEPVVQMAATTSFCGNCFLQRWTFGNDTVLSNGYSITQYHSNVTLASLDLSKMERTWRNVFGEEDPRYRYTLGGMRDKVPDDKHKTYYLKYTEVDDGVPSKAQAKPGSRKHQVMRQLYVSKGPEELARPHEVIELIWRR